MHRHVDSIHCQNHAMQDESVPSTQSLPSEPPAPPKLLTPQVRNPLHGITLEAMVTALHAHYDWPGLAQRIPIRCFQSEPSVSSSLKFLRKTPWAREKVEGLYLFMLREKKRQEPQAKMPRKYG
jgi:uncharacterized protein (DUF2132 family)